MKSSILTLGIVVAMSVWPDGSTAYAQNIYWVNTGTGNIGTGKIQRSCLNGFNVQDVVASELYMLGWIAIDVEGGKIYWTVFSRIHRANLDGTQIEDLVTTGISRPLGIALDLSDRKMYWTDASAHKIQRANLDGSEIEDLVVLAVEHRPAGIALDLVNGKVYWTTEWYTQSAQNIQRANLDGSNIEQLVVGLENPRGIAIDSAQGKMYWTDGFTRKIQRADLDGSEIEDLITLDSAYPGGVTLELGAGKMYFTDVPNGKILRSDLDGTDVEVLVAGGLQRPLGIVLDLTACSGPDCQPNGTPDECDLCDGTDVDCNGNDVPDECDIRDGTSIDCNSNVIPDECEPDCNDNGIADACDITSGTSTDHNGNTVPDECEDCNANTLPDECDLDCAAAEGLCQVPGCGQSPDCNVNDIPDSCDLATGTSGDCNANTIPDECDISTGASDDCNVNGVPDECEPDCNNNGIGDECDVVFGTSADCNDNYVPDECEPDCNGNGAPDTCERDCNWNGIADVCDVNDGTSNDCNDNGVPDECELDCNSNGVPDQCDLASGMTLPCAIIEFVPSGSTSTYAAEGNRMIIPQGGVQVEFEVLISGWGNTPGSPLLGAYNAVLLHSSLAGAQAVPYNPGVDLLTPSQLECAGPGQCPMPAPRPVTITRRCGMFSPGFCDDSEPGFIVSGVCANDHDRPCTLNAHCHQSTCIENPRFVLQPNLAPWFDASPNFVSGDIWWLGTSTIFTAGKADPDGVTKFLAGSLRLIVPEEARGTYTFRFKMWQQSYTFINDPFIQLIPSTVFHGQLTIGGACCMPDDSCEILLEGECEAVGGAFLGGFCGDDSDNDGKVDACDPCPNDNPDDSDGDGVCNSDDGCPFDPNKIDPGQCGCGVDDHADSDNDGIPDCDDQCPGVDDATFAPDCVDAIPTVSSWGIVILTLLLLIIAKSRFGRLSSLTACSSSERDA